MADDTEGRSLGGAVRVCLLPRVLLESAHERDVSGRRRSGISLPPPHTDASSAVPARSVLGSHHQQTADLSSGTRISAGRLVLFSRRVCSEICACISGVTDFVVSSCAKPQVAWFRQRWSAFLRCTSALAVHLGELACVYCDVHAQPA